MAETLNRSLARGLDILELLSEEPAGLELHRIAKALDIPKSSAFNLIHTLLDKRYVTYDEATSRYALSLRMFEMGSAAVKDVTEQSVVHQYMQRVYAGCNETVHCGVPDGTDMVYVDKLESTHSIRMTSRIGARFPLYCTAMGRAVLAGGARARAIPQLRLSKTDAAHGELHGGAFAGDRPRAPAGIRDGIRGKQRKRLLFRRRRPRPRGKARVRGQRVDAALSRERGVDPAVHSAIARRAAAHRALFARPVTPNILHRRL